MSGESIRCPQCGGSLDVGRYAVPAKCAYCGSTIQRKVDATGQALPVLEQLHQESSIVAKRGAMDYLQKQLQDWVQYKADLEHNMDLEHKSVNRILSHWAIFGAVLGLIVGLEAAVDAQRWFVYSSLLVTCGLFIYLVVAGSRANRQIKNKYHSRLSEADEKIKSHQARIQQLQEEVARLAQTV
jgi:hypothetical protein